MASPSPTNTTRNAWLAVIAAGLGYFVIMKAQGIPDFQAPPPIPRFIDTDHAIDELPSYDSFEPSPDDL
jgi:hypothetical protein